MGGVRLLSSRGDFFTITHRSCRAINGPQKSQVLFGYPSLATDVRSIHGREERRCDIQKTGDYDFTVFAVTLYQVAAEAISGDFCMDMI